MKAILLALVVLFTTSATSEWNQEARDYIVEIHNDRRRGENGCFMYKMEYDMELERRARNWAEKCDFKHEYAGDIGENLAFNTNKNPEKAMIEDSCNRWFIENKKYNYDNQTSCVSTGACHYLQMVWGKTNKIGCYSIRCKILKAFGKDVADGWNLVCYYSPRGNWMGEKPYAKGCTSKCNEGETEDEGLCIGEGQGGAHIVSHGTGLATGSDSMIKQNSFFQSSEETFQNGDLATGSQKTFKQGDLAAGSQETFQQGGSATDYSDIVGQGSILTSSSKTYNHEGSVTSSGETYIPGGSTTSSGETYNYEGSATSSGETYNHEGSATSSGQTNNRGFSATRSGQTNSNEFSATGSGQTNSRGVSATRSGQTNSRGFSAKSSGQTNNRGFSATRLGQTSNRGFSATASGETFKQGGAQGSVDHETVIQSDYARVNQAGGDCVDKSENCVQWAQAGRCKEDHPYLKENCKKSCNYCGDAAAGQGTQSTISCEQTDEYCEKWAIARLQRKNTCL